MSSSSNAGKTIILGGKGSSLSSSTVFHVSTSLSRLSIDSSTKISSSSKTPLAKQPLNPNSHFSLPDYLTPLEFRASLLVFLKKLTSISVPNSSVAAEKLLGVLNSPGLSSISDEDCVFLNPFSGFCSVEACVLYGVCALLDYKCATLLGVVDAIAALSIEALGGDVGSSSISLLIDSGDGLSDKDEVGVASDLRVFLNGSKLVGKNQVSGYNVRDLDGIPETHGLFRFISRTLHGKSRVFLNSSTAGSGIVGLLPSFADGILNLGESSCRRGSLVVSSLGNNEALSFNSCFVEMFKAECPGIDRLKEAYNSALAAKNGGDNLKFVHDIFILSDLVGTVLSWEAIAAFISLTLISGADIFNPKGNTEVVEGTNNVGADNGKANEKKQQKEKKKNKVAMGKGTTAFMQYLQDRLQPTTSGDIEIWVQKFLSILDPKDPGYTSLLEKVKDIVDSNDSRRLPKLPKGTRDFAKEQMTVREKAFSIISKVFKRHGATALDTPVFEMRETLMGKYGEDSKLIYDLADQGGELCSLRYDLTVPFARYVAMNGLTSFKRYQIAKVYRRDNPSKGRYREFYQCDFDIAGKFEKMGPDFEVIKILTELLDELQIGDYEVKLNHRKLLDGMLFICGVPPEKFRTICSSIDKLDKQPFEQIRKEMVEEKGLSTETADRIGTFVKNRGHPLELLSELKQEGSEFLKNRESSEALDELEILFEALEKSKCIGKVVFDLSLARGLDYYTGVIYEAVFKGATQVGSIAAGGRYDKLIEMFGTKEVPAIGVSLGIERVFTIMEQIQKDQNQTVRATETQVLVSILGDNLSLAAELAGECWAAGLNTEYLVNKRVTKHFDRAKDSRIPWMVIVGDPKVSEGMVKLKNLEANKEEEVPRSQIVEELCRRLSNTSL